MDVQPTVVGAHPPTTHTSLSAAGLVDEMIVAYAPCSLGAGGPVLPLRSEWTLAESGLNGDFVGARWLVRR